MISLQGAYDLHVHSAPCLFPRIATDLEVVEAAQGAGLAGVCLKSHHESTVGRAAVVNAALHSRYERPAHAYGSITLNHAVGGINPVAVEAALKTGAAMVWMPTVDSLAHEKAFGHTGGWDVQGTDYRLARPTPLSVLEDGKLTRAAHEILSLCKFYGVALGTGHLGAEEIFALARAAQGEGFPWLVVTHPLFRVPRLAMSEIAELAMMNVWVEFTYCSLSPMWRHTTVEETVAAIREVGVERAFLSSDGGQIHNPMPHEGLRLMAQMCLEAGVTEPKVMRMISEAPAAIIAGGRSQ